HARAARAARDKVLERMADLGIWSKSDVRDAEIEPVSARTLQPPLSAPLLARRLHNAQPHASRIRSTIDAGLQRAIEERVHAYLVHLPARTSAAALVVDNATMETRVYVGSGAFGDEARLGHVDMMRAWRSPGSTLKPFLYGLALDDGLIDSESLLVDAPQSFGSYRPGNFDSAFEGPVGAAEALRLSLNVPAVDLLDRVGPARFAARLANAGVALRLPRGIDPNLTIILGGVGARLEDLVGAYAALNRHGLAGRPRFTSADAPIDRRVLSPGAAWIVRTMLEAHPRPGYAADTFDPGTHPRVAWKTGTSYGYRDAWAIGSTRRYTVGVWIGRPDGTPLPGQYGAVTALPLMFQIVDSLPHAAVAVAPRPVPASVSEVEVCWPLGLAFDPGHPELCHQKHLAWVLNGVIPPTPPERDAQVWSAGLVHVRVDARSGLRLSNTCRIGRAADTEIARWPALAYPWLSRALRQRASLPALAPGCPDDGLASVGSLRIAGIADQAAIARAPNSDKPASVRVRALGASGDILWLINGKLAGETRGAGSFEHTFAQRGDQTITALAASGATARVQIRVLR
ncbi:MAG: penicillin-binding transpeptidase domain-containing protein, partial [Rhodanobacteraceae bacterium]